MKPDPRKTAAMQQWPIPHDVKALRGFLGLTGYYRTFVKGYGLIAAPLIALLRKDSFTWTPAASKAFQLLKDAMSSPSVLALPDFTKPFVVECDASGLGVGAVLMQNQRPIAYNSQALKGKALAFSTYEKELLALVVAVKKWRPYLLGRPFVIKTNHQSLKYLLEQKIGTPAQQKWITKLLGYAFIVEYKHGKENVVADALSRREDTGLVEADCSKVGTLCIISFPTPNWLDDLRASYVTDPSLQQIIQAIKSGQTIPVGFTFCNDLLFYKGKLYLGSSNQSLKTLVLQQVHDSPLGGHSGYLKSFHRLKQDFTWPGMGTDLKKLIKECDVCQRLKNETCFPAGLLQPLVIPARPWLDISMDFVEGLPKSQQKSVVFVVVDRFTKYVHFIPLAHPYTAAKVAQLFMQHVFKLHGLPSTIVSDRDPVFTSKF